MGWVSLGEIKTYLGLDGEEQNKLLTVFLETAEQLVEKVLREPIKEEMPAVIKTSIYFIIWQLYFNRDNKEFKARELEFTVRLMLSDLRKNEF